jgi:hypothetical protein
MSRVGGTAPSVRELLATAGALVAYNTAINRAPRLNVVARRTALYVPANLTLTGAALGLAHRWRLTAADVGPLLAVNRGDRFFRESLRKFDADRFGLFQSDQRGGRGEAEGGVAGNLRAGLHIVIRPAAADEAVFFHHVGLRLGELF